jgi:glycosyltransferase involved in cell wall biosynthesis
MKLSVAIPTLGRKELVTRILGHLEHQTRLPDEVVISAPDSTHVDQSVSFKFPVRFVFGKRGLCAQRNRALEEVLGHTDAVVFFDDDFIPASDYLEIVERGFAQNPDWAAISGCIAKDGAKHGGFTFEQGLEVLRAAEAARAGALQITQHVGANGANMSLRAAAIGPIRFDERLVLHGWHEDIDMTSQLRANGRIVGLSTLVGVHLGVRGGKASGVPFGYSQVINIVYLVRKGTVPLSFGAKVMLRNVMANMAKSVWSEPHIDRRGRLKGNLLGAYDAIRGRVEPEHILTLMR